MRVKIIYCLCVCLALVSCVQKPKYEYAIEIASESIENSTLERLKQRLSTITSQVEIIKKSNQEVSINFKSSVMDTIVKDLIITKGDLSFYETKNLKQSILVISELSKIISPDTTESQNIFYTKFHSTNFPDSAELGYVNIKDTSMFNTLFIRPEVINSLNKEQLRVKFAWGIPDSQTALVPLYALEVGTRNRPVMYGDIVSSARASFTQTGNPSISISMEGLQAEKWERLTRRASEERFAVGVVLDRKVIMAPIVSQAIEGGNVEISGDLKEKEAFTLSAILNSGPIQQLEIIHLNKQDLR